MVAVSNAAATGSVPDHASPGPAGEPLRAVTTDHNHIRVGVLPQVELISIVQSIGNYPEILPFLMSDLEFGYKTRVMEHFGSYAGHPAVRMFDRLSAQPRKLNFSAPSHIMLYADENLELRRDIEPDDFVLSRIDGPDSLAVFLDLLRDFAEVTDFDAFFRDHTEYYSAIIGQTILGLGDYDYAAELERFYGEPRQAYNIVLVSLYDAVGFGNSLRLRDGSQEIHSVLGAGSLQDGLPFFGDGKYLKNLVRHEFSHPFVNPVTEQYRDRFMPFAVRFDDLPEQARRNVCGEWEECINEFIIRAVTTWLARAEGPEMGQWAYDREKDRGVVLLDELLEQIDIYQSNRQAYPAFTDFYPRMLEVFLRDEEGNPVGK